MESQQHHHQNPNEDNGGSSGNNKGGSFLCRQSSSRWTPTTDQIRILKDLYYNNGVRSPSAEQIQRISARLRQYGKIEGKNVFYWFQNHKARERQKKRSSSSDHVLIPRSSVSNSPWKPDDSPGKPRIHQGYSSASSSSAGVFSNGVTINHGSWVGIDSYYGFLDKKKSLYGNLEEEQENYQEDGGGYSYSGEIETLPLFPMRGEDINGFCNVKSDRDSYCGYSYGNNNNNWYNRVDDGNNGSRASLELSLNSYTAAARLQ